MDNVMYYICYPLGYIMKWCREQVGNYGLAIILFTLVTKLVILPVSVWVHKNSIRMVSIQPQINRLKAAATGAVMDELENYKKQTVEIPFGNLIGGDFFTGRGPYIPIKISMSGTALSVMNSRFTSAGINQTSHQIELEVTVRIYAAIPGFRSSIETTTNYLVAETVLVGEVPDSFTQVDGDQADIVRKIFDYADVK